MLVGFVSDLCRMEKGEAQLPEPVGLDLYPICVGLDRVGFDRAGGGSGRRAIPRRDGGN